MISHNYQIVNTFSDKYEILAKETIMFYDKYESLCKIANKKPYTVARELGLGTSNVAIWKKGSTPRPDVLRSIANYFDVSIGYLLADEGQKNSSSPTEDELNIEQIGPIMKKLLEETKDLNDLESEIVLEYIKKVKQLRS